LIALNESLAPQTCGNIFCKHSKPHFTLSKSSNLAIANDVLTSKHTFNKSSKNLWKNELNSNNFEILNEQFPMLNLFAKWLPIFFL